MTGTFSEYRLGIAISGSCFMSNLRLPANIENMRRFVQFASEYSRHLGFSEKRIHEIELAIEEALVNICRYAYPGEAGDVELRCRLSDHRKLIIEIEDGGIPFDPLSITEPDLYSSIAQRKIGGLGIFFIRRMVDEVHYRREGRKNVLTFLIRPEDRVHDGPGQDILSAPGRKSA